MKLLAEQIALQKQQLDQQASALQLQREQMEKQMEQQAQHQAQMLEHQEKRHKEDLELQNKQLMIQREQHKEEMEKQQEQSCSMGDRGVQTAPPLPQRRAIQTYLRHLHRLQKHCFQNCQ